MKLKILSLIVFFACSACGDDDLCKGSDFETSQGICVFTNGFDISKDQLSYAIDVTEDVVSARYPKKYAKSKLNDSYDSVSISFVGDLGDEKDGYTQFEYGPFVEETYKVVSEYKEHCWHYIWIIPHEMLHVYLLDIADDQTHKKGWHWHGDFTDEENASSIQYEVYRRLSCDICGSCQ